MVSSSPLRDQMAISWLINGGDPNHLLSGMILQVSSSQVIQNDLFIPDLEVTNLWKGHANSPSQKGHDLNHLDQETAPWPKRLFNAPTLVLGGSSYSY